MQNTKHTFTVTVETEDDLCDRETLKGYLEDFIMGGSEGVAEDTGLSGVQVVISATVS